MASYYGVFQGGATCMTVPGNQAIAGTGLGQFYLLSQQTQLQHMYSLLTTTTNSLVILVTTIACFLAELPLPQSAK